MFWDCASASCCTTSKAHRVNTFGAGALGRVYSSGTEHSDDADCDMKPHLIQNGVLRVHSGPESVSCKQPDDPHISAAEATRFTALVKYHAESDRRHVFIHLLLNRILYRGR